MTPRETFAAIDAASWRMERQQKLMLSTAWHAAAFSRTKRMPSLKKVLGEHKSKRLRGKELERKREDHEAVMRNIDVDSINKAMRER